LKLGLVYVITKDALLTPKDDPIALLSLDYDWKISANTKFSHKSTIEAGSDSVITRMQNQLKQNITKVVALTVNHDYKNDNGAINTREGVFSLGLSYQF
jgi:putative salt-induced outer membrane protein